jgi:hypothetical protein
MSVHTAGSLQNSMDNSNTVDNSDQGNPDAECWVKLYQAVVPGVPGATMMDDGGTRSMATHCAMGQAIPITPVPLNIDELCRAVKAESAPDLNQIAAFELDAYEPMPSATDFLALPSTEAPMLRSARVPLFTTSLEPLVVVVPAIAAGPYPAASVRVRIPPAGKAKGKEMQSALHRANQFAASIMSDLEDIPKSNGMQVMRDVLDLQTGIKRDIVLRRKTNSFWSECMEFLSDPSCQPLFCVAGTPGIGKTAWTAFAIRMLLKQGKTVVYHIRGDACRGWYYEFVPGRNDTVAVDAYPETVEIEKIASLNLISTFYIVDPGQTKDPCTREFFAPKSVMFVASPVGKPWTESAYTKRGNDRAVFKHFPVWDLEEILLAQTYLLPDTRAQLTAEEVEARFWQVGGVPKTIFLEQFSDMLYVQIGAISKLTNPDPKVHTTYIRDRWDRIIRNSIFGASKIFETYCRVLMAGPAQDFQRRPHVGRNDKDHYRNKSKVALGGCKEIRMVPDIVSAAESHRMVIFHSIDPRHRLYDFMYCSHDGTFHAFQATMYGVTHEANIKLLNVLREQLGTSPLEFYYMIPQENFETFATDPVDPLAVVDNTHVWHILVPNPNGKYRY